MNDIVATTRSIEAIICPNKMMRPNKEEVVEMQVSRIDGNNGLPRGWRAVKGADGAIAYVRAAAKGEECNGPMTTRTHPVALPPTASDTPRGPLSEIRAQ